MLPLTIQEKAFNDFISDVARTKENSFILHHLGLHSLSLRYNLEYEIKYNFLKSFYNVEDLDKIIFEKGKEYLESKSSEYYKKAVLKEARQLYEDLAIELRNLE